MVALPPDPIDVRRSVQSLIADRHAPEARALYLMLARYAHARVQRRCTGRYHGVLGSAEQEELVAEVLYQLMSGALHRFEGDSVPALLAFVRTICDRTVGHHARARIRERDTLESDAAQEIEAWNARSPGPEHAVHLVPESPFTEADQAYLHELFAAGSKAEMARLHGVSRAAVTQRVQRIRARIDRMSGDEQQRAEAWVRLVALRQERGEARPAAERP